MQRISVTHISTVHPPFDIRIFHKECRSLAAAGYETNLVVTHDQPEERDGVRIIGLPKRRSRLARMLLNSCIALRRALKTKSDIFHVHDPELLPISLVLKLLGHKVIYDVHEDMPKQIMSKHWIRPGLRGYVAAAIGAFEDFVARRVDAVVAATPSIAERFSMLNAQTVTVNNFPLLAEYPDIAPWESREDAICYVGVISAGRGVRELILALGSGDAKLHLAGQFSPESFHDSLRQLPGWEKVEYHGYLGREDLLKLLSRCKVGAVTIHPQPNHLESQPIKLYEYMAAGLPVIVSDFPLWRQFIERFQCGICVAPLDPAQIADAILYLQSHPEAAKKMGENGRRAVVSELNWQHEERILIDLYYRLLQQQAA